MEFFIKKLFMWIKIMQKNEKILPSKVELLAIAQSWQVIYMQTKQSSLHLTTNLSQCVTLIGKINNQHLCIELLRRWLKKIANQYLPSRLMQLSHQTQLEFNTVKVRLNSTRWGSCNSKKQINLCSKLLFLPPHLLDHILLHELCHTREMNHGKKFWKLLLQFDMRGKEHVKELRLIKIPSWVI